MNQPPSAVCVTVTADLGSIYDSPDHSLWVKIRFFMDTWRRCLLFSGIAVVAGIITVIILVKSSADSGGTGSGNSSNPCSAYRSEDYASSVTLACFRFMWTNAGCKSVVPDGYSGWYLRSPSGGKTIPCLGTVLDSSCGAGSFGAMANTIFHCELGYLGRG